MSRERNVGNYRLLGELGEGAMGTVFRALDIQLDREVALKSLRPELARRADIVERFREEARLQGRLESPNIVRLYQFLRDGDEFFMVMEFVRGSTLSKVLAEKGRLDAPHAINIMVGALNGLGYAHKRNVIHRDVKPANIMIGEEGIAKVTDFGIARLLGSARMTKVGSIVGTLEYISPEAILGKEATALSDIYSSGVVLYELLTGRLPFTSDNEFVLAKAQVESQPPPLRRWVPDIPQQLEDVVLKALAKNPAHRFQTAEDMASALNACLQWCVGSDVPEPTLWNRLFGSKKPANPPVQIAAPTPPRESGHISELEERRHKVISAMNRRVDELIDVGNWQLAQREVEQSIKLYPGEPLLAELSDRVARELRYYQEAVDGARREARGLLEKGLPQVAKDSLDISTARYRDDPELRDLLRRAETELSAQTARSSEIQEVAATVAALQKTGHYQEAVTVIIEAAARLPNHPELTALLSRTMQAQREHEKSIAVRDCLQEVSALRKSGDYLKAGAAIDASLVGYPVDTTLLELRERVQAEHAASLRAKEIQDTVAQPLSNATRIDAVLVAPGNVDRPTADLDFPQVGGITQIFQIGGGGPPTDSDFEQVPEDRPPIHLVFRSCSDPLLVGKSVEVHTIPFRIGRSDADLSIPADNGVSRHHAEIDWINSIYVVRDLGSRNGTFIQGRRVRERAPEPVQFGATIRLSSSTELTIVCNENTTMPDLTGTVLDGRYVLVRLVRTTGKATLYEATDARLPHKVAVKVLSPILARYPGYLEDFQHEAEMAAELQHPHIVRVLDSGTTQLAGPSPATCNYACLELLAEGDLADRLRERGFLPIEEALGILDGVSNALEYAHGLGIVHRGLKPSSILFGHNGFAFLSDFAFAARPTDRRHRMVVGAPDFLAPEQWDGTAITAAADQYSLSALAYFMLTGSPPLRGQQDPDIRSANRLRGPDAVHEEAARNGNANIPAAVSDVFERALSPDPTSRYPSIREFFLHLKRAAGQRASTRDGPPRIFISYQRDTSAGWAVLFSRELEQKHGISAFVDTQRVDSAVQFPVKLSRAIKDCDIFVCFLSDKTLNSQWVCEEIRLAWENNKRMVPVFQENFEHFPATEKVDGHIGALISFEGVHLLDRRNIYVDEAISKLAEIIRKSVQQIRGTPGNFSQSNATS